MHHKILSGKFGITLGLYGTASSFLTRRLTTRRTTIFFGFSATAFASNSPGFFRSRWERNSGCLLTASRLLIGLGGGGNAFLTTLSPKIAKFGMFLDQKRLKWAQMNTDPTSKCVESRTRASQVWAKFSGIQISTRKQYFSRTFSQSSNKQRFKTKTVSN